MLVCTYRPVDVILSKQDLQVHSLCAEIALERLPEPAIAQYLATEFPNSSLPPGLANLIYRHSEGNPLFMVAIVQDMIKKGLFFQHDGEWTLTTPLETIDPGVPQSWQQMLEVQFERLTPAEQQALEAGSVVGEHFSAWVIGTALEERADRIEDLCDALATRQLVIKAVGVQELPNGLVSAHYEFRHSLYRQAIYRRLASGKLVRFHRAVAQRLNTLSGPVRLRPYPRIQTDGGKQSRRKIGCTEKHRAACACRAEAAVACLPQSHRGSGGVDDSHSHDADRDHARDAISRGARGDGCRGVS